MAKVDVKPAKNTISLLELQGDKVYAFGDNFARGGQALTTGLGFKESSKMSELSKGVGYAEVNTESLGEFDADYIFIDFAEKDKEQYAALKIIRLGKILKRLKKDMSSQWTTTKFTSLADQQRLKKGCRSTLTLSLKLQNKKKKCIINLYTFL